MRPTAHATYTSPYCFLACTHGVLTSDPLPVSRFLSSPPALTSPIKPPLACRIPERQCWTRARTLGPAPNLPKIRSVNWKGSRMYQGAELVSSSKVIWQVSLWIPLDLCRAAILKLGASVTQGHLAKTWSQPGWSPLRTGCWCLVGRLMLLTACSAQHPPPPIIIQPQMSTVEKGWGWEILVEGNNIFFASPHIDQEIPITGFCKHDHKMVPSKMNREMTIQRTTGLTWIPAPRTSSSTRLPKKSNSFW